MHLDQLTSFLGWCTLLNIAIFTLATVVIVVFRTFVVGIHSALFGLKHDDLPAMYFQYLGNYKLMILVFNLIPYLALRAINV